MIQQQRSHQLIVASLRNNKILSTNFTVQLIPFFFGAVCLLNFVVRQFKAAAKGFVLVNKYYLGNCVAYYIVFENPQRLAKTPLANHSELCSAMQANCFHYFHREIKTATNGVLVREYNLQINSPSQQCIFVYNERFAS